MPWIYLVSHCESCYNAAHLFTGRLDPGLTDNGIQHAQELAEKLKERPIDLAIRSSLLRTKETLGIILKYHPDCPFEIDDRIIERDYADLSGLSKDEYANNHPDLFPIYHRSYDIAPPNGESIKMVEVRVLAFLEEIIAIIKKEDLNVLVVCHNNSIRPMIRYFEKLTPEQMMKLEHLRHRIYEYQL